MRNLWLLVVAAAVAAGALTACTSTGESDGSAVRESAPAGADAAGGDKAGAKSEALKDVTIVRSGVEDHEVWGPGAYVVHYKITNSGKGAADYFAQLEFLDADGDVLGTTGVTADKLGPGKSKQADTAPLESEIENGKPSDIRDVRVTQVDRT
ncbi:hypothetical protein ACFVW5_04905 [Streptomyces sp. NPDC058232]|uniref:hypothetical protein n=1 Tax=Streptomyces sp. NPDC058232 TaxID=3346393 RepID=UPI0036EFF3AC